ncbi:class I SAM-dependent DNA methyltransferase [uncultured Jatrophihabitans sp.]|uniref:class I SAM-dependent DNA methyltransferase n=1 Tax=uncultured Jatrophihabitans sp. TaxID=1610747 RepID=UPI0035C94685
MSSASATPSLPEQYFRDLYARDEDPWRISDGWYEQRKRALVLAALPSASFGTVFEPGCSNGELTVPLAGRCDRLVAWDVVDSALARTRERTADRANVEVRRGALPGDWPDEPADLVVLSEVGYYLDRTDLRTAVDHVAASLRDGGSLVAVHWRHPAPDYPLSGDEVHDVIEAHPAFERLGRYRDEDVVLDVLVKGNAVSVARAAGVV